MWPRIIRQFLEVNKELWVLLMMFTILAGLNYLVASDRMMLGFYVLPTVYSAYFRGRRHAVLTAFASVLLVILVAYFNPRLFTQQAPVNLIAEKWWDITVWGGTLIVIGYAMGTLYEKKEARLRELKEACKELRETYRGVLVMLQQFIAHDEFTEHHSRRVAEYAAKIAEYMGLDPERIDDVFDASLLHDIGKMETSRQLLYKAARFTDSEYKEMTQHVEKGVNFIQPVGGRLERIIPIILAHHDKFDGNGYHPKQGEEIPLEARIISVADVYDSLTSDRPYRKAMSPLDAKESINKGSGTDFDPTVVKAFLKAYRSGALEIDFSFLEMRRR
jgi:putative nucleotidyltransferase with HDIG domain